MKVVLCENDITGETMPPYFAKNHIKTQADFRAFRGCHDIFALALEIKRAYKARLPGALVCPLLRLDFFENQCFEPMLNEAESLEALVDKCAQADLLGKKTKSDTDTALRLFRKRYWKDEIQREIDLALAQL